MAKHRIYIREDIENLLEAQAKKHGIAVKDIIRMRIETMSSMLEVGQLRAELSDCQKTIQGLFKLIAALSEEVAFVAGATRFSTKEREDISREGHLLQGKFRAMIKDIAAEISD